MDGLLRVSDPREPTLLRVVIVGCGKAKASRPAPAKDLYTGGLFKASRAYAEAHSDFWFVASAKHGLLEPDQVIEPYDEKLKRGGSGMFVKGNGVDAWRDRVHAQLLERFAHVQVDGVYLTILAGGDYELALLQAVGDLGEHIARVRSTSPLGGKQIGERLQWLARQREHFTHEAGLPAFRAEVGRWINEPEPEPLTESEANRLLEWHLARVARRTGGAYDAQLSMFGG